MTMNDCNCLSCSSGHVQVSASKQVLQQKHANTLNLTAMEEHKLYSLWLLRMCTSPAFLKSTTQQCLPTLKTLSKQIDWLSCKPERVRTPPEPLRVPHRLVKKTRNTSKPSRRSYGCLVGEHACANVLIRDLKLGLACFFPQKELIKITLHT